MNDPEAKKRYISIFFLYIAIFYQKNQFENIGPKNAKFGHFRALFMPFLAFYTY